MAALGLSGLPLRMPLRALFDQAAAHLGIGGYPSGPMKHSPRSILGRCI